MSIDTVNLYETGGINFGHITINVCNKTYVEEYKLTLTDVISTVTGTTTNLTGLFQLVCLTLAHELRTHSPSKVLDILLDTLTGIIIPQYLSWLNDTTLVCDDNVTVDVSEELEEIVSCVVLPLNKVRTSTTLGLGQLSLLYTKTPHTWKEYHDYMQAEVFKNVYVTVLRGYQFSDGDIATQNDKISDMINIFAGRPILHVETFTSPYV